MRPWTIVVTIVAVSTFSPGAYSRKHRHSPHRGCIKCLPGEGVIFHCNATHDTVCKPCESGFFSLKHSHLRACQPCSRCGDGLYVAHTCSPTADTICDSCQTVKGPHNRDFYRHCESEILATVLPIGLNKHRVNPTAKVLSEDKIHLKENVINDVKDILTNNDIASLQQLLAAEKQAIEEANVAILRLQNSDNQLETALEQILEARLTTTTTAASTITPTTRAIETTMAIKSKFNSRQHIEFHSRNSPEYPQPTQSRGKLWTSLTPSTTTKTAIKDGVYALKRQSPKNEFNEMIGQSTTTQWTIVFVTLTCAVVFFGFGLIILHNVLKHFKPNLKGKWEPEEEEEPHEIEEQKQQLIRTSSQAVDLPTWKSSDPDESATSIEEVVIVTQTETCSEEVPIDDIQEEKMEDSLELQTS